MNGVLGKKLVLTKRFLTTILVLDALNPIVWNSCHRQISELYFDERTSLVDLPIRNPYGLSAGVKVFVFARISNTKDAKDTWVPRWRTLYLGRRVK